MSEKKCSNCGFELNEDSMFCTNCGMRQITKTIQEPKSRCVECGHEIANGTVFCTTCGAKQPKKVVEETPKLVCPVCGTPLEEGTKFCTSCGTKLDSSEELEQVEKTPKLVCPVCGTPLEEGKKFCTSCGTKLDSSEAPKQVEETPRQVCPVCGTPLEEGTKFCTSCGTKFIQQDIWTSIYKNRIKYNINKNIIRINSKDYPISSIKGAYVSKNDSSKLETKQKSKSKKHFSLGKSIAGGLVFGTVGAVVGGSMGKVTTNGVSVSKSIPTCNHISVIVNVDGFEIEVCLLDKEIEKSSHLYKSIIAQADKIVANLHKLVAETTQQYNSNSRLERKFTEFVCPACGTPLEEGTKFCTSCGTKLPNNTPVVDEKNSVDVLKKLKELKDLDLITEDEYTQKKKEILDNLK